MPPSADLVRRQYEEYPYPEWTTVRPDAVLADVADPASILVAGCGTGRDVCSLALTFPRASVLAVDVSRPSLEYAAGRADALGVAVTFHLYDLLDLRRRDVGPFDLILAAGILHHLDDPSAGMARLASLLAPDGTLALGLYSRIGRRPVVRARQRAAELGYVGDRDGVRRFRRNAATILDAETYAAIAAYPDLRYDAGVRDLIFPAREATFDLAEVADVLSGAGLSLGRLLVPRTVADRFSALFPGVPEDDLDAWQTFERQNPETFRAMYRLLARRIPRPIAGVESSRGAGPARV